MRFKDVIGQEKIKEQLIASVSGARIPHAQMFFGAQGSGSLGMAIAYAQFINCEHRTAVDSCGQCHSCVKFEKLAHPDLHFAYPVNTNKKITKDPNSDDFIADWREMVLESPYFLSNHWYKKIGLENKQGLISKRDSELIIKKLSLKSFESDYKFLILWLPEKMNATSANMLLKLVEEPPEKTIFLFVSEDPSQVLLTITSRTQPVKLGLIDSTSMAEALQLQYSLSADEVNEACRLANGNLIKAREIIESSQESEFNFLKFTEIMRLSYGRKMLEINAWVDEMSGIGREGLKNFFEYSLRMVRESFTKNIGEKDLLYMKKEEDAFSVRFSPYINGRNVVEISEQMNKASFDIEHNGYPKLVLFDFALRLVKLIRA